MSSQYSDSTGTDGHGQRPSEPAPASAPRPWWEDVEEEFSTPAPAPRVTPRPPRPPSRPHLRLVPAPPESQVQPAAPELEPAAAVVEPEPEPEPEPAAAPPPPAPEPRIKARRWTAAHPDDAEEVVLPDGRVVLTCELVQVPEAAAPDLPSLAELLGELDESGDSVAAEDVEAEPLDGSDVSDVVSPEPPSPAELLVGSDHPAEPPASEEVRAEPLDDSGWGAFADGDELEETPPPFWARSEESGRPDPSHKDASEWFGDEPDITSGGSPGFLRPHPLGG